MYETNNSTKTENVASRLTTSQQQSMFYCKMNVRNC